MNVVPLNVLEALAAVPSGPHVVVVGNFDGLHRGHRYLIDLARQRAVHDGVRTAVVTFEPHPNAVLRPDQRFERLTPTDDKERLLQAAGIEDVITIPFGREFAALSPETFLETLSAALQPTAIIVGEGFRFGARRAGNTETLRAYAAQHGFEAVIAERLEDDDAGISSSAARAALRAGDLVEAERVLGRRYRLCGRVQHGAARGRELGYPTANLLLPADACVPADGIYAAYAHVEQPGLGPRQAMVYIGPRPMFDNGERQVEVNILDFIGDLYTQELGIEFVAFIRADAVFESVDDSSRRSQTTKSPPARRLQRRSRNPSSATNVRSRHEEQTVTVRAATSDAIDHLLTHGVVDVQVRDDLERKLRAGRTVARQDGLRSQPSRHPYRTLCRVQETARVSGTRTHDCRHHRRLDGTNRRPYRSLGGAHDVQRRRGTSQRADVHGPIL